MKKSTQLMLFSSSLNFFSLTAYSAAIQVPGVLYKLFILGTSTASAVGAYFAYSNRAKALREEEQSVIETKAEWTTTVGAPFYVVEDHLITNFTRYWKDQDKHLMLVGGTGDGKSTLIKGLLQEIPAWGVNAYDIDYAKGDYSPVVNVYCDYETITASMCNDSETLASRIKQRQEEGAHVTEVMKPWLLIGEELPSLVSRLGLIQKDWITEIAKRGRKVKMFLCVCMQNDTVANTGFVGDSKTADSCFLKVRLGKFAIEYAQIKRNYVLVEWLKAKPKGRFLVDDRPCEWIIDIKPNPHALTTLESSNSKILEQVSESKTSQQAIALTIQAMASDGKSNAQIVEALWGFKPSRHSTYKEALAKVEEALKK